MDKGKGSESLTISSETVQKKKEKKKTTRDSYILPEILIFCVKNKHPSEFDVAHQRQPNKFCFHVKNEGKYTNIYITFKQ